jgi:predicted ATPase/DNA-binding CsgD family transcriptional regulator
MAATPRAARLDLTVSTPHHRLTRPLSWGPGVEAGTANKTNVQLPTGTATILVAQAELPAGFSDEDPAAAVRAGVQCASLLSDAIGRHGGVTPNSADATIAAFGRASDALAAAIDAQRALALQAWPTVEPISVGIALHTAETETGGDGHSLGGAVERCELLRRIAHGGQTIVSRATGDLVAGHLPDGIALADLGLHRLRDLRRAEPVFGVLGDGMQAEFPPLRSLSTWPNNLPEQPTSFVGREQELELVSSELTHSSLVVLTGTGGAGKTRLALQAAADNLELFDGGVWCVELAPLADGELLGSALADAVGARRTTAGGALQAAIDHLADARALVLLDNCEHLLAPVAGACERLVRGCPQLTILATSRAPLGLENEIEWRVPPLSLPAEHAPEPLDALGPSDAVSLFIERARAAKPRLPVSAATAPAIAQICHDLDGIPLAIELAAARAGAMSVQEIADGLGDRFRLLTGGAPGLMPRQQTLRASVDWSYELLAEDERALLSRLSVFVGSFSADAVESVCTRSDLLASLVHESLVVADETGLFRLLQTVREYAQDRLAEADELAALRDRHLDYFLALAHRVAPRLLTPDQNEALRKLDADSANLTAAIQHGVDAHPKRALELAEALGLWWTSGHLAAGELALGRALAAADTGPSALRARAIWARGAVARQSGEFVAAYTFASEALAMAEAVGDPAATARALVSLSTLQLHPDPVASRPPIERAIALATDTGDDWALAHGICAHAYSYVVTDEFQEAERLLESGLPIAERIGAEALMYYWVGYEWCAQSQADAARTFEYGEQAVAAARKIGVPISEALAHLFMGWLETAQDRADAALERLRASEARLIAVGAGWATPQTRIAIAGALAAQDVGAARELLESIVAGGADQGFNLSLALILLSSMQRVSGDANAATESAQRALELAARTRSAFLTAGAHESLGRIAAARGDWNEAETQLQTALTERVRTNLRLYHPQTLDSFAHLASGLESYEEAARLLGAAGRIRSELGIVRWPQERPEAAELERRLIAALGSEGYETALAEGERMPADEAFNWVQRSRGSRKRPLSGWGSLTPTEVQVVKLVSEGLTNPQIAQRMFISRATVKVHLGHVFQKLDVRSRSELAAQSARRDATVSSGDPAVS